jgi:hypothetical protein
LRFRPLSFVHLSSAFVTVVTFVSTVAIPFSGVHCGGIVVASSHASRILPSRVTRRSTLESFHRR